MSTEIKTQYTKQVHHGAKHRAIDRKNGGFMNPPPITLQRITGTRRVEVIRAARKAKREGKVA